MASSPAGEIEGGGDQRSKCSSDSCNFFSNENTNGLCSLCFKKRMSKMMMDKSPGLMDTSSASLASALESAVDSANTNRPVRQPPTPCCSTPAVPAVAFEAGPAEDSPAEPSRKKARCAFCAKRLGLLGLECRCGKLLCTAHRQPEEHCCQFDYREAGRAKLAEDNPLVSCSKIERL